MSNRHKAIKNTLDVGTAEEWDADHMQDFTLEIEDKILHPGTAVSAEWDTTQTSSGSAPVWELSGSAGSGHADVILNTGAATGQTSSMRLKLGGSSSDVTSPDDLPGLNMALQIAAVHTAGTVAEWGFFKNSTTPFTANQEGAYFRIKDNNLYAVTGNGISETAVLIGAFLEYSNYRIIFNSGNVQFYADDLVTASATITTTRPTDNLTIKASVISANNVDSTLTTDAIALSRLRKQ